MSKAIGIYSLVLGSSIIVLWIFILSGAPLEEGRSELCLHLISESIVAGFCVVGGFCMARGIRRGGALILPAHSMMLYSLLNAAGYYLQKEEGIVALLFLLLLFPSMLILIYFLSKDPISGYTFE